MSTGKGKVSSVLVIGTGFAGLAMAVRLKEAGIHDFTILERASSLGGTWRDNTYPGAACDIQSHLYSFSFEPNPTWTRMFGQQREILAYMEHVAEKYRLMPHMRFDSPVLRAVFDEREGVWDVTTKDGVVHRARVVVSGTGPLNQAAFPQIEGRETFAGKSFHSSNWDHSYSLEGKRVAILGTGASAIQVIPEIADRVASLHVFQRTPPWIMPKPDRPISDRERALFKRVPVTQKLTRAAIYWFLEWRALAFTVNPALLKRAEPLAIRYLEKRVKDPVLREKLRPKYTLGCKRVLMSNDYFETLQKKNVSVVTDSIREIRPDGIVTSDGEVHEVDAIVYATGFHASEAVAPFEVRGTGGRELNELWKDGAEAYLGTSVAGFPNWFLLVGPNTGLGHNSMVFMIESQVTYVLDAIKKMRAKRWKTVDVLPRTQAAFNAKIQERLGTTIWQTGGCTSWYQTRDGKNTTLWPGFTVEFRLRTRRFHEHVYACVEEDRAAESAGSSNLELMSNAAE
jgi:cation diffusion facilitator CzcD-associated flavoprotein CzcO